MISQSLAELLALRVNREMPRILDQLRCLTAHLQTLSKIGESKAIEPRDLMRCAGEAKHQAIELHHALEQLAGFRASVRRRHLGESHGGFSANFRGLAKQIGLEFDRMDAAARALDGVAAARIGEPGRWGDAAAPGAISELSGLLFQLLELWGLLRVRKKLDE